MVFYAFQRKLRKSGITWNIIKNTKLTVQKSSLSFAHSLVPNVRSCDSILTNIFLVWTVWLIIFIFCANTCCKFVNSLKYMRKTVPSPVNWQIFDPILDSLAQIGSSSNLHCFLRLKKRDKKIFLSLEPFCSIYCVCHLWDHRRLHGSKNRKYYTLSNRARQYPKWIYK